MRDHPCAGGCGGRAATPTEICDGCHVDWCVDLGWAGDPDFEAYRERLERKRGQT